MNESSLSSTQSILLERMRAGDNLAYRDLLQWIGPQVNRWCRRLGLNDVDAEEVFQESFAAVFQNLHRFEKNVHLGGFRAWLWTIVSRKAIDLRRKANLQFLGDGIDLIAEFNPPEQDDKERNDLLWSVCRIVRTEFTESSWKIFWATTVENRIAADVASELGMSAAAVRKTKSRVLAAIRKEMAVWIGEKQE